MESRVEELEFLLHGKEEAWEALGICFDLNQSGYQDSQFMPPKLLFVCFCFFLFGHLSENDLISKIKVGLIKYDS